ncbi:lachesin-like [Rhipicephalus microplus]|uniref:lachesin-like n=1 Tax=Rhipicephalus microplus TaxID=6941 RepID=UPI003F6B89EB
MDEAGTANILWRTLMWAAVFALCIVPSYGHSRNAEHFGAIFKTSLRERDGPLPPPSGYEILPEFAEPVPNVSAIVGRTVKLPCVVNHLGQYRVAWLRVASNTILTIHKSVITQNYRVHLSPSDRTWLLVIDNVQESDRGGYMCQVNTVPMRSQVGYIDVLVPPDIVGSESSSDVLVREGSNVTLSCRAKGYPAPRITWRREDGTPIAVGNWQEQLGSAADNVSYEGEELSITKVSRLHMGPYLCIASNGVPSPVSRRILLQVHFPPMIWIPNQLIGAPLGGEVVMICNTEAYPISINYWTLESGDLIAESPKYSLNRTENVYKVHMRLHISRIAPEDFGAYRCFAKNSLGSTEGSIRLYEIHVPPTSKVKEPSTARIQSVEEGKLEASDAAVTKHQSFPLRPPMAGSLPEDSGSASQSTHPSVTCTFVLIMRSFASLTVLLRVT